MKRTLLSIASALTLAAAMLPTSASAQHGWKGGGGGGGRISVAPSGGGGGARIGAGPGGGGAAFARSAPSGGNFAMQPKSGLGGQAFVQPGGGKGFVQPGGGGQRFVQGNAGNWQGGNWPHHRRHFRGPVFGFAGPAYYDYATPYYSDDDDGCYQLRAVETAYGIQYRRIWVCD
jgi:hypothetical protein